jgi:hypothetical protein
MYDALRKAEEERKRSAGFVSETEVETVKSSRGGSMSDKTKISILLIAVVCVFGVAFYRFNAAKVQDQKAKEDAKKKVALVAPAAVNRELNVVKPQRDPGTYGLDGIINSGEQSMAVVNGKLLKPEQSIDHLILKKISAKEVELLNTKDNSMVILKI